MKVRYTLYWVTCRMKEGRKEETKGGKPENQEIKPFDAQESTNKLCSHTGDTKPSRTQTRVTLMRDERSHHYANHAFLVVPLLKNVSYFFILNKVRSYLMPFFLKVFSSVTSRLCYTLIPILLSSKLGKCFTRMS